MPKKSTRSSGRKPAVRKQAARATSSRRSSARKAPQKVEPVPRGYHTITPHIIVDECARAIEFYKTAFGAKERGRMPAPGGKIAHAEIQIGDSVVMLNDEMPPMAGHPGVYKSPRAAGLVTGALFLYVRDVDKAFERAVTAGCAVRQPLTDMFWGDRYGQVIDPFGHTWGLAKRIETLTMKQIQKRQQELLARMPAASPGQPTGTGKPAGNGTGS